MTWFCLLFPVLTAGVAAAAVVAVVFSSSLRKAGFILFPARCRGGLRTVARHARVNVKTQNWIANTSKRPSYAVHVTFQVLWFEPRALSFKASSCLWEQSTIVVVRHPPRCGSSGGEAHVKGNVSHKSNPSDLSRKLHDIQRGSCSQKGWTEPV